MQNIVFMLTILFCKNMLECMQIRIQVSQALMCRNLGFSVPPEIGALGSLDSIGAWAWRCQVPMESEDPRVTVPALYLGFYASRMVLQV
jgi:hypothetical protein